MQKRQRNSKEAVFAAWRFQNVRKEGEQMVELDAIKYELSGYEKPLLEMGDSL